MKSKTEQKLDVEFERMGVRPRIYHFTENVAPFNAITIADLIVTEWDRMRGAINYTLRHETLWMTYFCPATRILDALRRDEIYGVAICDPRDQFNRQLGRIIAKGRLLKHLKEVAKQ